MSRNNHFKKTVIMSVFFLLPFAGEAAENASSSAQPADEPRIKYSYEVVLTTAMNKALKEYSPEFRISIKEYSSEFRIFNMEDYSEEMRSLQSPPVELSSKTCYSAIFGDFNGDKRIDAAVFGENDYWTEGISGEGNFEHFPVVAILSEGTTGYQAVLVATSGAHRPVKMFLKLIHPQIIKKIETGEKFELKYHAVGLGWPGDHFMDILYWDENAKKFEVVGVFKDGVSVRSEFYE